MTSAVLRSGRALATSFWAPLIVGVGLAACGHLAASTSPPKGAVLASSSFCRDAPVGAWALWIGDETAWKRETGSFLAEPAAQGLPKVNFSRDAVVVFGIGQRLTAGYSISAGDPLVVVEDGKLIVNVVTHSPEPGQMVAQVLTSPCIAIRVERAEFQGVVVRDQDQRALAVIEL